MADFLGDGMAWLNGQLKEQCSVTVTYRRGDQAVELQATRGQSMLRVSDGRGASKIERTDRDFMFDAADLVLDGEQVEPADGDTVDLGNDRFELMAANGEPSWRYSNSSKSRIRVRTKYQGAVS